MPIAPVHPGGPAMVVIAQALRLRHCASVDAHDHNALADRRDDQPALRCSVSDAWKLADEVDQAGVTALRRAGLRSS